MDAKGVLSAAPQEQTAPLKYVQDLAINEELPQRYIQKDVNVNGKQVTADDSLSVPTIDVSRLTDSASIEEKEEEMEKLKSASISWGMFQAVGHAIPKSLLDDIYNISKQFFDLPLEEKQKYASSKVDEVFDLQGFGSDSIKETNADQILDWSDYLNLVNEPIADRNLQYWPGDASLLNFRSTLDEYSVQTRSLFEIIIKSMAKSLGLEENAFFDQLGDPQIVYTTFNFYPPCPRPDLVYGLKAHTDGGAITILLPDPEVRGLQVQKNDQWVSVPCVPGALLVNIGDSLQVMSNGIFKSPWHRAVTNSERTRISLGNFYFPHHDREIEPVASLIDYSNPRKYDKVKMKDFLAVYYKNYSEGKPGYDWNSL
ncbi:hypothetical protein C5167_036411 [Papaver somniferum]|uniref:Fe2OG dioxygenase domain-containing protein n=1 Tax=Papaver somniferum TaxID=3469 RepID=A0A4Y7I5V4_PAPSO|nr:probable 2-oxoglutarate-dependent dioxygenase ANS [Papaver somniferum]RZC43466.1 hypothetical protein C5167_036411 [Papaver somniferum]